MDYKFSNKNDWRGNSKIEWIRDGLDDLVKVIKAENIESIAIPALGAGLGGLKWNDVLLVMLEKLIPLKDTRIEIYEPK